jgi:hypothetical protein
VGATEEVVDVLSGDIRGDAAPGALQVVLGAQREERDEEERELGDEFAQSVRGRIAAVYADQRDHCERVDAPLPTPDKHRKTPDMETLTTTTLLVQARSGSAFRGEPAGDSAAEAASGPSTSAVRPAMDRSM